MLWLWGGEGCHLKSGTCREMVNGIGALALFPSLDPFEHLVECVVRTNTK